MSTIRNPIEWTFSSLRLTGMAIGAVGRAMGEHETASAASPLAIRRVGIGELGPVIRRGIEDFAAYRTDVVFLCVIYPIVGLILAKLALSENMLPLLFPLASGFALIGPLAGVGLYELSRRREQGVHGELGDALTVIRSPAFGKIVALGLLLLAIFVAWIFTAYGLYVALTGERVPASATAFATEVLTTGRGWALIGLGCGVGFLYALLVLAIGAISFPLLLDRDVSLGAAITLSARAMMTNPGVMAAWGIVVAGSLVIGSIPAMLGLIFVMPVLGHATWHLYRLMVPRDAVTAR